VANLFSDQMRFYVGGYDPGTSTTNASVTMEVASLDRTSFGDSAERVQAGVRMDSFEWSGWFADGQKSFDSMLGTIMGTAGEVVSMYIGTTTGDRAFSAEVLSKSAKSVNNIKELVRAEAEFIPDGNVSVCRHFGSALSLYGINPGGTGTVASGSLDDGAASTGTGYFFTHVLYLAAVGGTGTFTSNLHHSTNNSTWSSKVQDVFTATGSKKTAFVALNRYVRVVAGIASTSTGTVHIACTYERG
jgi:hypothetical protein